jgi:hypothetical protein
MLKIGGTYQLPMQKFAPDYWVSALNDLRKDTGEEFDFVALAYSECLVLSFDNFRRREAGL